MDDDDSIRTTLAEILREEGYEVDVAQNGAEAISKSNARLYDLALVDMRLPDMNGTEVLSRMRETVPKTAKVIVTGFPTMQNAIDSVNRGADGYVLKPVDAETLLWEVERQLERRMEAMKYSEEKVNEFIESRVRELGM